MYILTRRVIPVRRPVRHAMVSVERAEVAHLVTVAGVERHLLADTVHLVDDKALADEIFRVAVGREVTEAEAIQLANEVDEVGHVRYPRGGVIVWLPARGESRTLDVSNNPPLLSDAMKLIRLLGVPEYRLAITKALQGEKFTPVQLAKQLCAT